MRFWLWLLVTANLAYAVKDYLFKTCDQSGFCHRNRHFSKAVAADPAFESKYKIARNTVQVSEQSPDFALTGSISKLLPSGNTVELPFRLTLYLGNSLRFTIDEDRVAAATDYANSRRFNETSSWAFASENIALVPKDNLSVEISALDARIKYGANFEYTAILTFSPPSLQVLLHNEIQVHVNSANLLNVEHLRSLDEDPLHHLWKHESPYAMFEDLFKDSSKDSLPLGPESVAIDFAFPGYTHLYGLPEHADSLALKDTTNDAMPYRLFNVDIFEYETDSRFPMYGSIPLVMAVKPNHSVGVFWVNSADTYVDIDKLSPSQPKTHFMSENGQLDFVILVSERPSGINRNYGLITGFTMLPQLFALGYHQCRWNYNDEADVLGINSLMDKHHIPYDTIWLDIEYADHKKYFTWNRQSFPDTKRMLDELDRTGRNLVAIIDPHLKTGYFVSDNLVDQKITIKSPHNDTFKGHCWPGELVWIDSMNPNSQAYWDKLFSWHKDNDFMGGKSTNLHLWNDMNEPSVFDGPETSSPKDNLHYGDWEHRLVHNLWGMSFHELTFRSLRKRMALLTRQRPFILTRSYFAGSQRTAAMWTGDNMSKWEYLKALIPMVLTSNVVGMPFAGADVGGFFGNPSKELLTRWYQTGIWYPFFRAHAHIDSRRREPWVPGEPYTLVIRSALQTRYLLLPTIYTCFRQASQDGTPVMKPLFYDNAGNVNTFDIDDQFFLGDSGLMVKPVTWQDASTVEIYIPDNERYYDISVGDVESKERVFLEAHPRTVSIPVDLSLIPMLLRGGLILARKDRARRSSRLMARDPYTLVVALDKHRNARGKLYIDDGESYGYTNGEYVEIDFIANGDRLCAKSKTGLEKYAASLAGITIERIIVLGDKVTSAVIVQSNAKHNAEILHIKGESIVRNPRIEINLLWEIQWVFEKAQDATPHDEL